MIACPKVSIVIIFLNGEQFIAEAVASVLAQTYEQWELLLVDDGSTDRSTALAKAWAKQHPNKVRYLEHPGHKNRGMSASRNLGIAQATGEYVAFLDCDDVWLPYKLERQVKFLNAHPTAGMVYGRTHYWHSWTGKPEDYQRDSMPVLAVPENSLIEPPGLTLASYPLGKGTAPCPSDLMVRRTALRQTGGFEESFTGKFQLYEDQAFLAKMYLHWPTYVSAECWDRYRIHANSCMAVVNGAGQYHAVRSHFLNWFKAYLTRRNMTSGPAWNALNEALRPYQQSSVA